MAALPTADQFVKLSEYVPEGSGSATAPKKDNIIFSIFGCWLLPENN